MPGAAWDAKRDSAARRRSTRREAGERGVTLLELVIAMTVFALLLLGIAATVDSALVLTRNNRNRTTAANLASQEMDLVRTSDFASLQPRTAVESVGDVDFTVNRELTWVAKAATSGPCDASGGNPQVLRVRVSVTWPDMKGVVPAVADTVLTPPVGAYDPNTGHIAVKVLDRDAQPVFLTPVYVSGPESRNLTTNSEGCASFAFLTPGTYTVSLGSPGMVDRQGDPAPAQTVGVSAGVVSSAQFDFDAASTLDLTLTPDAGGLVPDDVPVTVWNPMLLPAGSRTFAGTGNPRALADLFPFLDGYALWVGECADADPEGQMIDPDTGSPIGPYWPTGVRDAAVATTPGAGTVASVRAGSLEVSVSEPGGLPAAGQEVVATHAADDRCGAGETHVLGITDATGHLSAALPFGTWQVTVTGRQPDSAWPSAVLDPTQPVAALAEVTLL